MDPFLAVAWLTWQLIGHSLFIGLPSGVTVQQVCIDDWICYVPDNPQLLVVEWKGANPAIMRAQIVKPDGVVIWVEAYGQPPYKS